MPSITLLDKCHSIIGEASVHDGYHRLSITCRRPTQSIMGNFQLKHTALASWLQPDKDCHTNIKGQHIALTL